MLLSMSLMGTAKKLLKFGTLGISSMLVFILISKIIFIKYLPPVRPKLVSKLSVEILLKYVKFEISIIMLIYLWRGLLESLMLICLFICLSHFENQRLKLLNSCLAIFLIKMFLFIKINLFIKRKHKKKNTC